MQLRSERLRCSQSGSYEDIHHSNLVAPLRPVFLCLWISDGSLCTRVKMHRGVLFLSNVRLTGFVLVMYIRRLLYCTCMVLVIKD